VLNTARALGHRREVLLLTGEGLGYHVHRFTDVWTVKCCVLNTARTPGYWREVLKSTGRSCW